jgi:hypothetical protein
MAQAIDPKGIQTIPFNNTAFGDPGETQQGSWQMSQRISNHRWSLRAKL